MQIGRSIDAARRRVVVRVPEGVSGRAMVRFVTELLRGRPQLANYDFIYNMLRFDSDIGNDDVAAMSAIYLGFDREPGPKYTVFVILDPNFEVWAKTMDHSFGDRVHQTFQTQAEAEAYLDHVRGLIG